MARLTLRVALERVVLDMLPANSKICLLRFVNASDTRRLLQSLDESEDGVEVEFEVILTKQCEDMACKNSEDIAAMAYDDVTADLKTKVETGLLTKVIQEEADAEGLSEFATLSVKPDSLKANVATVMVRTMFTA